MIESYWVVVAWALGLVGGIIGCWFYEWAKKETDNH